MSQTDTIDEMLLALNANIDYLKQAGNSQTKIRNGKLTQTVGEKYVYQFELEFLQSIDAEAEIEVRVQGESANGKIAAVNETSIQIELDANLGNKVSEAWLIISNYYLLELLRDRLGRIRSGELEISDLVEQVFTTGDYDVLKHNNQRLSASEKELNTYQQKAVDLALANPVAFVWGPPGTGKTETIASIIEGYKAQGKTVLLLAHTNVATDEALLKTVEHLGEDADIDYREGKILRVGDISKEDLKPKFVTPEKVAERNGQYIRKEIAKIQKKIDELTQTMAESAELIEQFEILVGLESEEARVDRYCDEKDAQIQQLLSSNQQMREESKVLKQRLAEHGEKSRVGRLFSGVNPEQINHRLNQILVHIGQNKDAIKALQEKLDNGEDRLDAVKRRLASMRKSLKGHDYDSLHEYVTFAKSQIKELKGEKKEREQFLADLQENLILEAKVVATTLTKSYSSQVVLSRPYDCVIIDEASMAPLPAVYCATGLARTNVVIVGDFVQLPPVTKHKVIRTKEKTQDMAEAEEKLIQQWLMRDIFSLAGIESAVRSKVNPHKLEQLKKQYRFVKPIADLVNEVTYKNFGEEFELETDKSTQERFREFILLPPLKSQPLGFYDTSTRNSIASQLDSGSLYNLYNALVCVTLAEEALSNGMPDVGIISAYRAQVNLITKMVADRGLKNIAVDTVHRFQGGEKTLIIVDVTTAKSPSMYDDREKEGIDMKLLNVAISRSHAKCIFVGDIKQLEKSHSDSSPMRTVLKVITNNEYPIVDTERVLNGYSISQEANLWLNKMAGNSNLIEEMEASSLFDETNFYKAFKNDLLSAKTEVIIDSPYMTTSRVETFIPIFDQLRHKGVKIFILTRIASEQSGKKMQYYSQQEIERLSGMGIKVLPFAGKIHRKIAVIDRKILWEGSLNILSQNDSTEIMRRFEGASSASQMLGFLKLDKNIGPIGEDNIHRCEFCTSPEAWYWTDASRFGGLWTYCLFAGHKQGVPPRTQAELAAVKEKLRSARKAKKETTKDGAPICPQHELVMIKRTGRFGEFWGCPRYPACRITERIKKEAVG